MLLDITSRTQRPASIWKAWEAAMHSVSPWPAPACLCSINGCKKICTCAAISRTELEHRFPNVVVANPRSHRADPNMSLASIRHHKQPQRQHQCHADKLGNPAAEVGWWHDGQHLKQHVNDNRCDLQPTKHPSNTDHCNISGTACNGHRIGYATHKMLFNACTACGITTVLCATDREIH